MMTTLFDIAVLGQAAAGIAPAVLTPTTATPLFFFAGRSVTAAVSLRAWRSPGTAPA